MSSLVRRIERAGFFARPRQAASCTDSKDIRNRASVFNSCRSAAAGTCLVPDDVTWTGDSCVCATLNNYNAAFSKCMQGSPYSACIDSNNDKIMVEWSAGHCEATTTPAASSASQSLTQTLTQTSQEESSSASVDPSRTLILIPSSSPDARSSPLEQRSTHPASSPPRSPSSSPSASPGQSSVEPSSENVLERSSGQPTDTQSMTSSATLINSSAEVPTPELVPVVVASQTSATGSATHTPLARWTGSGKLLQGYCAQPDYTLLDGPTAYWAPILGCVGDKSDCCPFEVATQTTKGQFPSAQAVLNRCPDDYQSISNECCPSNYRPWSTTFGGQVPCYSTLPAAITPPPIPATLVGRAEASAKPTSAIINVVYAMQYPLKQNKPSMSTGAKAGISVGVGSAIILLVMLLWLFPRNHRADKRNKSINTSSAVSDVKERRDSVSKSPSASQYQFKEGIEVQNAPAPTYTGDWEPRSQIVSTYIPHPYARNSMPSSLVSEADSQTAMLSKRFLGNSAPRSPGLASNVGSSGGGHYDASFRVSGTAQ